MSKFDELITTYDYLFTKQYRIDPADGVRKGHTDAETGEFVPNVKDGHVSPKPILPTAILDNLDSEVQKVEIAWWESGPSKWKRTVTNRETLVNNSKITKLADRGVPVGSDNARNLSTYFNTLLCEFDGRLPRKPARSVMGWCELDERTLFMPYTDLIQFDGAEQYRYEYAALKTRGTLEEWVKRMEPFRLDVEIRLMMAAAFASPLISIINENPFVFHLYGGSGSGKTVTLLMAMSIWGDPTPGKLTKSMNTTINAMMERAAFLNSIPFGGDELQTIKNRWTGTYDSLIMQITEGINRGRMKNNEIQEMLRWKCAFLFTGEEPCVKATSGGGVVNRCIQVEIKRPLFDANGPDSGNAIVNFVSKHYGNAGPAYIERIMAINAGLAPVDYTVQGLYQSYFSELVTGNTTEKQAGAMALMLTGDRIAHDLFWNGEEDPKNHGEEQLTVELVSEYLATRSQVDVAKRAYKYVLDLISINSEKFFSTAKIVWGKRNCDDDADPTQVYFIKTALDQQMTEAGFDFDAVKKSWYANGYIVYNERHKTYSFTTRIGGMPTNCVLINLPNTEDQA
jgi:hypothetical protein